MSFVNTFPIKVSTNHFETLQICRRVCGLTLNAPIVTKVICFSRLLKCLRNLYGKSVDPDQTAPIGAVCSGSTLFASMLNSLVMLGIYLQQTISADDISDAFFSWCFKG